MKKEELQDIKERMLYFVWETFADWGEEARKKAEKYLDSYASGYTKQHNEDYGWQLTNEEINEVVKYVVENY